MTAAKWLFTNQVMHRARSYKKYMPANKNISEQQKPKQKKKAANVIAEDTIKC